MKEREKYFELEDEDMERYQKECGQLGLNFNAVKDETNSEVDGSSEEEEEPEAIVEPVQDVIKPKKPSSSYLFFSHEHSSVVRKENPDIEWKMILKLIS